MNRADPVCGWRRRHASRLRPGTSAFLRLSKQSFALDGLLANERTTRVGRAANEPEETMKKMTLGFLAVGFIACLVSTASASPAYFAKYGSLSMSRDRLTTKK